MESAERSIVVNAPVDEVYRRWSDLTSFPTFMDDVKSVTKTGPDTYHWKTSVGPVTQEFDARATFVQDQSISWHSTTGDENAGTVDFTSEGPDRTKITVRLEFQPSNIIEKAGASLTDRMGNDLESALQKFKSMIESGATANR
jgi:uncharacterized membrane protein